jgi:formylglycine-generating enzyme required for sulfatase activity
MKKLLILLSVMCVMATIPAQAQKNGKNIKVPEMALVPAGTFLMGNKAGEADERPVHKVALPKFLIGKFEVTYGEFAQFIAATNYKTDAEKIGYSHIYTYEWTRGNYVTWRCDEDGHIRPESDSRKPVIHVSWNDADAYCKWLSKETGKHYRLPSEAEWEYAAGNGEKHNLYSWGDKAPDEKGSLVDKQTGAITTDYAICSSKFETNKNGCFYADNVGMYQPNDLGLYDMCGNVWEWCADWYKADYYKHGEVNSPRGPKAGENKVIRGASWVYYPEKGTTTYRSGGNPTLTNYNLGFRVACDE